MIKTTLVLAVLASHSVWAQVQSQSKTLDFNQHLWVSYSGDHPVSGPWGLHFDLQWRRTDLGTAWQQYQIRPGINYAWSPNVRLTLGYAFTRAYPYGDFPVRAAFPEHRIYQQALIRQPRENVTLQHRIRLEQRWIRYPSSVPPSWTYQNRFRYSLKADFPLGPKDAQGRGWYLPIYDEILIGIPPNYGARPFDQNRLFVGIGRSLPKANVELGWMNQFLGQRNGRIFEFNNTIFLTVTSTVPLGRLFE